MLFPSQAEVAQAKGRLPVARLLREPGYPLPFVLGCRACRR